MSDIRQVLEAHVRDWSRAGLLDDAQRDRILADLAITYGPARAREDDTKSRFSAGVWILLSLGTAAMAAALAVWFAREWGDWGRWTRVLLSLGIPAALALVGLFFLQSGRRRFPALGRVFLTLTAIATLSATQLLLEAYDFHPRHAILSFVEAGLFGVMAFLADSALLLWAAVITLSVAFGFEVYAGWGWTWIAIERPLPFVGLGLVIILGGLLAGRLSRRLAGHLLAAGTLIAELALYALSLKAFDFHQPRPTGTVLGAWLVLFTPFLLALALLAVAARRRRGEDSFARAAVIPLYSMLLLVALSSLWPGRFYERSWVDTVLFTLVTIAGALFGVHIGSAAVINVSVVFFAIDVFSRFSEWFWEEMPAVYFFGLMGLLLISGGIALERVRRRLIRRIGEGA
ncbi:MAG TPA: DUF2157 domain-containing protein [Thermoanaerobaculia bacterium]|nr:DUF2157 domain-containing protein [Thermoanaerobaculia bacterium]